jgi:hypothetical protein
MEILRQRACYASYIVQNTGGEHRNFKERTHAFLWDYESWGDGCAGLGPR